MNGRANEVSRWPVVSGGAVWRSLVWSWVLSNDAGPNLVEILVLRAGRFSGMMLNLVAGRVSRPLEGVHIHTYMYTPIHICICTYI